ncbi:hypothetical protein ACOZ4N_11890 [Halorientalis pallida]|uniref:hypothetical protein n=1 Tax=Halorientalis pallida TaxID=2479928 RepID=UPI003C6FD375
MAPDGSTAPADLTEDERAALHQVELGLEWLHRAHGHLVEFHHNTGHAMDHLAEAEPLLRECGYDDLADAVRDRYLPHGVIDDDRWSYDVLESFQEGFLDEIEGFEREARDVVADGQRHAAERAQERTWKERAGRERPE